ncbi:MULTISPECIES: Cu(I)-responsive transcriptional regulator [Rhizobium/Agrobacterium group]|jgi:Cu(I)-responsive transcriptional regulator|uniref:Cu(I)-responsive transcriptional regulator n=1 Tax=Rhizobium rhizogenes TaxID=359 RepID=A0A546XPH7_RHIRH|nr:MULTISPECIES: Cu(I)-responsive transcriptional regulator [Rhizobium/Agrobacterium group]MCZ7463560.1 Cu(I)-responsive transcriptional regulator [Rhizobium rhizogenes]MCZ7481822.1 Cu(I)-responsive transcriptional regulator [Rhizobium rhizogenes]MCZ7485291.1 Cu(I)-responsive transcriptional regulator [Rhizobium rhizogenes]MDA5632572.1 Cu(I)-responsive transcriptional regulator [Agrobacterium sp. ST15.16.024]MDF1888437.1 Cu(I)-responsive transcriptional regulator [Rhizobium rhizogenes]
MNIGTAATASGVSAKMIRHYEMIGLIKSANRTDSGYRVYTANDLETLRFIRRGRDLGFSIEKIRQLMTLWRDPGGASCDVKRIVMEHVVDLEAKMHSLRDMADTLRNLATYCPDNGEPDCPIIQDLAQSEDPDFVPVAVVPKRSGMLKGTSGVATELSRLMK